MIKMEYIQEFVTLAGCLSFTQTAQELFITQPSLSRHLAAMEEELGFRLIERSTRQVKLTPAGEELYPHFVGCLSAYRTAMDRAGSLKEGVTGSLNVCNPRHFMEGYVEETVWRFRRKHPDVRVDINYCSVEEGLELVRTGKADITMGIQVRGGIDGLDSGVVIKQRLSVLVPAEHPLAGATSVSISDLNGESFVFMSPKGVPGRFQELLDRLHVRSGGSICVYSPETLALALKDTGGVCLALTASGTLGRDYLRSVPLTDPECAVPVCFYSRSGGHNPTVDSFLKDLEG